MNSTKTLSQCLLLVLLAAITTPSCKSTGRVAKTITIESGQVPPDMKNEKFILIGILYGKRSYDKYVEKEFKAYTGEYVLAKKEELTTKYADRSMYRYVMDYSLIRTPTSSGPLDYSIGYEYFIRDRKTGTYYKRKSKSSFFALEMKAYLKAIEAVRKQ